MLYIVIDASLIIHILMVVSDMAYRAGTHAAGNINNTGLLILHSYMVSTPPPLPSLVVRDTRHARTITRVP